MKFKPTERLVYSTVPFLKGDLKIEFITALIDNGKYDLQVAVYINGDGGIFRGLPAETHELTHSHRVAWVVRYYLQNVLPSADPHEADLIQIGSIMQAHVGEGFPTQQLIVAGWILPEPTAIPQNERIL